MQKKWLGGMLLILAALAWAGCGEDGEFRCDDAEIRGAQDLMPAEARGDIALMYEGMPIPVKVSLSTVKNECGIDLTLTQHLNPACGTTFDGQLTYDKAATPPEWTGELWGDHGNTRVLVTLVQKSANVMNVNADIVEARDPICKDRTLTGDVSPR